MENKPKNYSWQSSLSGGFLLWRNNMRPKRYPYTKPQWEKEYTNVYWDSSNEPLATFVTHVNRLTGEIK